MASGKLVSMGGFRADANGAKVHLARTRLTSDSVAVPSFTPSRDGDSPVPARSAGPDARRMKRSALVTRRWWAYEHGGATARSFALQTRSRLFQSARKWSFVEGRLSAAMRPHETPGHPITMAGPSGSAEPGYHARSRVESENALP